MGNRQCTSLEGGGLVSQASVECLLGDLIVGHVKRVRLSSAHNLICNYKIH